jgi:uncharacterized membrane protein HdeD (DUF308 family)
LRGVAAGLFGVMAVVWPEITIIVLVALFGAYALVDGLIAFRTATFGGSDVAGRRGWFTVEGIAGVLTFVWPDITTLAPLWVIAAWALVTGVLEIVAAIRLRREIDGERMLALSGVLTVLFGDPAGCLAGSGALALVVLIGIHAIVVRCGADRPRAAATPATPRSSSFATGTPSSLQRLMGCSLRPVSTPS